MKKIIGWGLSGVLIIISLKFVTYIPISSILLFLTGLTFVPNIRGILKKKTKKHFSFETRRLLYGISFIIIFIVLLMEVNAFNNRTAEKKIAKQIEIEAIKKEEKQKIQLSFKNAELIKKQEQLSYFNENMEGIISKIKELIDKQRLHTALSEIEEYIFTNNQELITLKKEILDTQKTQETKSKSRSILLKLKAVPSSNINKNLELYSKLQQMNPNNKVYQDKKQYYTAQLKMKKQEEFKEIASAKDKAYREKQAFGTMPIQSSWDGSYSVVERHLKKVMHDPSSLDMDTCSSVYKIKDQGWGVLCSFRGKNAFGGVVLNSKWFIIRHNQVIKTKPIDAYSL